MTIDVRVAHINVLKSTTAEKRHYNIDGVVEYVLTGGVGTLNEAQSDISYTRALAEKGRVGVYHVNELAVLWDTRRYEAVYKNYFPIMQGGYVGADGTRKGPDNRRVGPNRYLLVVVLRDKSTGITFQAATTHLVAQADTKHKWRRAIRAASIRVAGLRIAALNVRYPNGFLNGDMNYRAASLDFPYVSETQFPTLVTYGTASRYDRAYGWGQVRLLPGTIRTFTRKSDHKGITYVVRIGAGIPVPPPKPVIIKPSPEPERDFPSPGDSKAPWVLYGAPVAHPWADRSVKWKKDNPRLWKKIVAWQNAYRKNPNPRIGDSRVNWLDYGAPVAHPWVRRSKTWKRRHARLWNRISAWQRLWNQKH